MSESEAENALISRAVAGEQAALEELMLTYYDRLSRRIARKLPASLRAAVNEEDILQQTFTEVFQRIRSFQPRGKWAFYRWMITIAEHRLQDAVKAQQAAKRGGGQAWQERRTMGESESMDELIELLVTPEHSPRHSAARHEAVAAVQVGLASLTEDHREAIQLRHIQGLPLDEAAKAMNKTPRAVRHLCERGLAELRVILGRSSQFFSRG